MNIDITIIEKESKARIRQIREDLGLTQKQFAEKLDMSYDAYKKFEKGNVHISGEILYKLKEQFGVSADYIIAGENKDLETVWHMVQNCDDADKMEIYNRLYSYFVLSKKPVYDIAEEK